MGRKKNNDSLGVVGVVIALIVAGIAAIPTGAWIVIGLLMLGYAVYRIYVSLNPPSSEPELTHLSETPWSIPSTSETPLSLAQAHRRPAPQSYQIPAKPSQLPENAVWLGKDHPVDVAGFKINAGMLYVGTVLRDLSGSVEPGLVNPLLSISTSPNGQPSPRLPYWPRYSEIPPQARGAYLQWLADGRKDPHIEVGYVFLFFYGLERRVIVDIAKNSALKPELADILEETRRLLNLYGEQSGSVRNYLSKFISLLELLGVQEKSYALPLPTLSAQNEVPYYLRVALGQLAVDGVPLPGELALAWAERDPTISRRLPATRCQEAFRRLFLIKYKDAHGDGLKLTVNKTKLKLVYVPASAGFRGANEVSLKFGDIPDVTLITAPIRKLQSVVDASTVPLEQLSRYLGRNPDKKGSLESLLLLPPELWEAEARDAFDGIRQRMGSGMITLSLKELADLLGGGTVAREKMLSLATALQAMKIGMEPDTLSGAKTPKAADKVVLFNMDAEDAGVAFTPDYHLALLKLQLAVAVANSDGDFSGAELHHIADQIPHWTHLPAAHHRRLRAHLRLLREAPINFTALVKRFAPLDQSARETIGVFAASIAHSDGQISLPEMKFLEKLNQALGFEANNIYRVAHEGATNSLANSAVSAPQHGTGSTLNHERIAELQRDSERVARILSDIFVEEPPVEMIEKTPTPKSTEPALLGLDAPYERFLRAILARPAWSREELRDVADDLQLMLDGALETINEAAFDHFDIPCTEGDDPIDVSQEFKEKIEQ